MKKAYKHAKEDFSRRQEELNHERNSINELINRFGGREFRKSYESRVNSKYDAHHCSCGKKHLANLIEALQSLQIFEASCNNLGTSVSPETISLQLCESYKASLLLHHNSPIDYKKSPDERNQPCALCFESNRKSVFADM